MDSVRSLLDLVIDKLTRSDPAILGASVGFLAATSYLGLVRSLRWRRYNNIHKKYEKKWREGGLTPVEAQEILLVSSFWDFPLLLHKAVSFALFKTYAITEILIATFVGCPINGFHDTTAPPDPAKPAEDPRAAIALARMNFIHSKYRISNNDYLYTLSLFILEPAKWAALYSWRSLSRMEQEAFFLFYADVGRKMGITDIPETLDDLRAWSEAYEEVYMVPDETNNLVAGYTVSELLYAVPKKFGMKSFAERVVIALLEERVRIAMLLPAQPLLLKWFVQSIMATNWIVQRWFCLPRRDSNVRFVVDTTRPKLDSNGDVRLRPTEYKSVPWYMEEPKGGLSYAFGKLAVGLGVYAEMPGPQSQGYRLEEVGPQQFENAGVEEVFANAEKFQGCPIVAPWRPATGSK
ncbi:hypothetical protein MD484_g6832, partial [Candolleomyces efflorescens]